MFFKCLAIFVILVSVSRADKLKIAVYYETECPYSKQFFEQQVGPVYNDFKEQIDIKYIPFGKSHSLNTDGGISFECQHHEDECAGNVWELCVLNLIGADKDKQTDFVICDMSFERDREQCTLAAGVDPASVQSCIDNDGIHLLLAAEKVTSDVLAYSGHVPTIVYNNEYSESDDSDSLENFYGVVELKLSGFE